MFVDALILAFVLVAWTAYMLFRFLAGGSSQKKQIKETTTEEAPARSDVFFGGTAKKDRGEVSMTGSVEDKKKKNQYGFVEFGFPMSDPFAIRFELLIEDPDVAAPLHAFVWLSLGGDPEKESAASSNAFDDGGMRVFLLKTDVFGQRETLEVFRTIAGVARASGPTGSPWDLVERVQFMPTNQWVLVTISGDLRSRTFHMTLDDAQFSFVVPMHYEGMPVEPRRVYLGAKTLKGTGIRIRNLGIKSTE